MKILTSRKGFTLIELLVVIGILAVLAAIAIPSVAGLIDRANVSADKTNANEMTNAIERFTSEYELYCQDIASGVIKDADSNGVPDDMDGAQGRVFNVTKAMTRANITALESTGLGGRQINRDTKYPVNAETMKAIIENYTKTSSSTFEPKQSDMNYWYSPACGVVVVATPESTIAEKNDMVISGMDAKGRELDDTNEVWINLTSEIAYGNNGAQTPNQTVGSAALRVFNESTWSQEGEPIALTWEELKDPANGTKYGYAASAISDTKIGDGAFSSCYSVYNITLPSTITTIGASAFGGCEYATSINIPNGVTTIGNYAFNGCYSLTEITIPGSVTYIGEGVFASSYHTSINFGGTMAQWNNINFAPDWDFDSNIRTIICTDGTITLP